MFVLFYFIFYDGMMNHFIAIKKRKATSSSSKEPFRLKSSFFYVDISVGDEQFQLECINLISKKCVCIDPF